MGCDIHVVAEVRRDGKWIPVEWPNKFYGRYGDEAKTTVGFELAENRNYAVFAILANVRNGSGFAGCDTGDRFEPISEPRGVPEDAADETIDYVNNRGYHSHSYITLTELNSIDWARANKHRGFVNAVEFERWDRMRPLYDGGPESYCGDVNGGEVKKISNDEMRAKIKELHTQYPDWQKFNKAMQTYLSSTYTKVEWEETYAESAGRFYVKAIPALRRLGKPEDVRIVFSFDN